jgi:2-C-methyl-D-erythritol 4-phosphate cytidylyltransferase
MKVVAIIPAAGLGTRMIPAAAGKTTSATNASGTRKKSSPSKQFTDLGGLPILLHTLRKFAACPEVTEICVALRRSEIASFRARLERDPLENAGKDILEKKVQLVEGGEHRQQSVANALAAIQVENDDIILVHDAVRPFVTREIIQEVIAAAQKYGAAIAGLPAVDTVKQVERTAEGAVITATLPRERVVLAQTPQGFRYGLLKKVFDEAAADGFMGTDEASLVERSGHMVAVVMGSPRNIKITTPADLELAEFFLKR